MCTLEERPNNIYILTIKGTGEHRLNPDLIDSIRSSLSQLTTRPIPSPAVLITTAEGKFFSNGYDLAWGGSSQPRLSLMSSKLQSLIRDLISLPMPTVAAVTGHASAAGLILTLAHDYILMRKDRGFLYMSELDIGMVIPAWFRALINSKIGTPSARREVVLRAGRLTAARAVEMGIVDSAHDGVEETVKEAVRLAEELVRRKWDGEAYRKNRTVMIKEVLEAIAGGDETVTPASVEAWAKSKSQSKL